MLKIVLLKKRGRVYVMMGEWLMTIGNGAWDLSRGVCFSFNNALQSSHSVPFDFHSIFEFSHCQSGEERYKGWWRKKAEKGGDFIFRFLRYTQPSQGRMGERFFFILFIHSDFYEILFPLNFSLFFSILVSDFFSLSQAAHMAQVRTGRRWNKEKSREKEGAREEEWWQEEWWEEEWLVEGISETLNTGHQRVCTCNGHFFVAVFNVIFIPCA